MAQTKSRKGARTPPAGGPTLDDVSRLAKVSSATVSRVLNNPEIVAEATRERVFAAIRETGYVPNLLAGGLASNRSRLVAAFVPGIASSIFNETIEAMTRELAAAGYLVVLGLMSDQPEEMDRTITSILSRRPDGLILTSAEASAQIRKRLKAAKVTVIETWDFAGAARGRGHRLLPRRGGTGGRAPRGGQGLSRAARDHGGQQAGPGPDAGLPRRGGEDRARPCALRRLGPRHFGRHQRRRAVRPGLGGWGPAGPGRVRFRRHRAGRAGRGLGPPPFRARRMSLSSGFGGSELGAFTLPPLTSVRIDGHAIGRQAAQVLLGRAKGIEPARRRIDVGFEIVLRESL